MRPYAGAKVRAWKQWCCAVIGITQTRQQRRLLCQRPGVQIEAMYFHFLASKHNRTKTLQYFTIRGTNFQRHLNIFWVLSREAYQIKRGRAADEGIGQI